MAWLIAPWVLARHGILGMNGRNINYIARYNSRNRYPLVDNKLLTKKAATKAGITVPKLLASTDSPVGINQLMKAIEPLQEFVLKPVRGSGGKGIIVIERRDGPLFVKASGNTMTADDIRRHVSDILSGLYSLGGKPDAVMVEERVHFDPMLFDYSYEGVPDLRIIVFRGFPVMAMLRCATHSSGGRANLHQGAIGVGIDIRTGASINAVQKGSLIDRHPDTGHDFSQLKIPNWDTMLDLASRCYEVTGLGYLGCDIVLDQRYGPMILELNARPGLTIQVTNGTGILPRLRHVETLLKEDEDACDWGAHRRVMYAKEHFGRPDAAQAV